jgi:leucyl-tRNA synthetase
VALPYDPHELEARWRDDRRYEADLGAPDLRYHLAEFPYPSADGLHVGHVFKYGGLDVYSRYWRMRGHPVFQPIGFDSFGIHTENFALKVGEHPARVTERTIANFRRQLSSVGIGWDWSRMVVTSDPAYYRWTQWVFVQLFRAGLAYQAEAPVIWCPSCLTVLAREQVDGETCERCDAVVTERVMRQWFLRTTAYADRLRRGLDGLDWPEKAKNRQGRWIDQLHDWLISRQRYWGPPIPIVHCEQCGPVAVPEDQLPVVLPEVDDFRPTGTGVSPLAAVEEWVRTTCPSCGSPARRETDVSDTFFDSSWYFLRYPCTDLDDRPWDPARVRPADFLAGGPEHVTRHHLYARFVTMALHDLGLVPFEEPFPHMRLGGLINMSGAKMSKSRGNVVSPDDYLSRHGADVLRMALLFSGRWEEGGEFSDAAVVGIERFLSRVWRRIVDGDPTGEVDSGVIEVVGRAYERLRFNVAIARLMESWDRLDARTLVLLLAPLAPYVADELWQRLGGTGTGSVHDQRWPGCAAIPPTFGA